VLQGENESLKTVINAEAGGRCTALFIELKRLKEEALAANANAERKVQDELKRLKAEVYTLTIRRNGLMDGNCDLVRHVKSRDRRILSLEKLLESNGIEIPRRQPWQQGQIPELAPASALEGEDELLETRFDEPDLEHELGTAQAQASPLGREAA
jgi:hypothetical protein